MSWGCHPDTLTGAAAQGRADRTGHKPYSLEWMKAYREAYKDEAGGSYPESLAVMLSRLDEQIAEMAKESDSAMFGAGPKPSLEFRDEFASIRLQANRFRSSVASAWGAIPSDAGAHPEAKIYREFWLYIESGESQSRLKMVFDSAKTLGIKVVAMVLRDEYERKEGTMRTWTVYFETPEPIDDAELLRMTRVICPENVPHGFYD
jgi:hypothetical protein